MALVNNRRQLQLRFLFVNPFLNSLEFLQDFFIAMFIDCCCRAEEAVEFAAGCGIEADAGGFLAVGDADEVIGLVFVGG